MIILLTFLMFEHLFLATPCYGIQSHCPYSPPQEKFGLVLWCVYAAVYSVSYNILEELVVQQDGVLVENFEQIVVASEELRLRCLSHTAAGIADLVWVAQEAGQDPTVLLENSGDAYIAVSYDYNVATVTINNVLGPFRGTLRCHSATLESQITVFIAES